MSDPHEPPADWPPRPDTPQRVRALASPCGWEPVAAALRRFDAGEVSYEQAMQEAALNTAREWNRLWRRLNAAAPEVAVYVRELMGQRFSPGPAPPLALADGERPPRPVAVG